MKAVYRGGSESIIQQLARRRRRKPLTERYIGIIAFFLWLFYLLMFIGALPILINLLGDCDNLIDSAVLKLEYARKEIEELSMNTSIVDKIMESLKVIRFGNYLYLAVEIIRLIILVFILYYLNVGNIIFVALAPVFFIVERIGWYVADIIISIGVETIESNLFNLAESGILHSHYAADYLAQHLNNFSIIEQIWNSGNFALAVITHSSRYFVLVAFSWIMALIVGAYTYFAFKEVIEE